MSGGGGTNTTTTQQGPPPQFLAEYQNLINQAGGVANQPLQTYPGQIQAGLSPDQLAGIQGIQGAQGAANPYIDAAAGEIGNSTNPLAPTMQPYADQAYHLYDSSSRQLQPTNFSAGEVQKYESPYTQDVVNATQNQFNNSNAMQQSQVLGNAASQGAFGGDRQAVAAGITAGQQQQAEAPVIAGLNNQGYAQALQEFNQQQQVGLGAQQASQQLQQGAAQGIMGIGSQELGANEANAWLDSQAGFGLGNLGNEAMNSQLTGANALLGVGGLEQQQAQGSLNIPYQQFLAQQAYPFQTTGWLANIGEGLGGASGGSGSTTSPGPSGISQAAGLGITGLALNQMGAFNGLGSLFGGGGGAGSGFVDATSDFGFARGGTIPRRAPGGMIGIPTGVPDVSMSIVPGAGGLGDSSGHKGPNILNSSTGVTQTTSGGDSPLGGIVKLGADVAGGVFGGFPGALAANAVGSQLHFSNGGGITSFPMHKTRMPGTGGIMGAANSNFMPHMPKLAAGGVAIPSLPTGGGGILSIKGGNGVSIPQLSTTGLAGGSSGIGGVGIGAVNDYLSQQSAGAFHPAPPAPPPSPAAAAAAAAPSPAAAGMPNGPTGLNTPYTGPGGFQIDPNDPSQFVANEGAQLGTKRGGAIPHRDDGGGLSMDLSNAMDAPVEPGMPGTGGYAGAPPDEDLPIPPIPPVSHSQHRGAGISSMPIPPIPPGQDQPQGGGITGNRGAPPPSFGDSTDAGKPTDTDSPHSPWGALLAAGLGIMGGTSPHALTNIGRGGLEGLQFGEQQRAREESASLRRLQQQDIAAYRQGQLQNTANRNDTYSQRVQDQTSTDQARAALMMARASMVGATHATEGDILGQAVNSLADGKTVNPDTQQPWTRADALMHVRGTDSLIARRQAQTDQGDQRLAQGDDRLDLRRQAYQETAQQHGIQNDQRAQAALAGQIKGMSDQAIRLYAGSKDPITGAYLMKPDEAERVAAGFRTNAQGQAGAPTATPTAATPAASGDRPALSSIFGE